MQQMGLICCGIPVKRTGILERRVRKIKALMGEDGDSDTDW